MPLQRRTILPLTLNSNRRASFLQLLSNGGILVEVRSTLANSEPAYRCTDVVTLAYPRNLVLPSSLRYP